MAFFLVTMTHPDGDGWGQHVMAHVGFLQRLIEVGKMTTQNNEIKLALTVKRNNGNPDDFSWLNGLHQRLELLDTNGVKYQSFGLEIQSNGPNLSTFQMQFIKPPNRKIGKPSQLHCVEWVPLSREIEFTFKNIPLP